MLPEDQGAIEVEMVINGEPVRAEVAPRRLLVDFLREDRGLTGTHAGCEHGVCGACTVVLDGSPVRSCIMLTVQASGAEVVTIEGVTPEDGLNPIQAAFKKHHGLQCGFCTPGFIMTLSGVNLDEYEDESQLRDLLSGNVCRCTGYSGILAAAREARESLAGRTGGDEE